MVCRGQHTCSCCPRLGTEPAEPCQEQGAVWQAVNMNTFMNKFKRGSEWSDGTLVGRKPAFPFPNPLLPKAARACVHELVGWTLLNN